MFGYVKPYKPEMKICEYEAYKAVYCTICKQLRKRYGFLARFTLSYDFTFLAMFRLAINESTITLKKAHCPFNPFTKCNHVHCEDTSLQYACDVAMMMVYYKWKDTMDDEGLFKRFTFALFKPIVSHWYKKASKNLPDMKPLIEEYYLLNKSNEVNAALTFDEASHPTADTLGKIFAYNIKDTQTNNLMYNVGYNVGKWVYLIDAFDDFQRDKKKNQFNPYRIRLGENITIEQLITYAQGQMNLCMDEACRAYDSLSTKNFSPILYNILFLGMNNQLQEIVKKVKENA